MLCPEAQNLRPSRIRDGGRISDRITFSLAIVRMGRKGIGLAGGDIGLLRQQISTPEGQRGQKDASDRLKSGGSQR